MFLSFGKLDSCRKLKIFLVFLLSIYFTSEYVRHMYLFLCFFSYLKLFLYCLSFSESVTAPSFQSLRYHAVLFAQYFSSSINWFAVFWRFYVLNLNIFITNCEIMLQFFSQFLHAVHYRIGMKLFKISWLFPFFWVWLFLNWTYTSLC